MMSIMNGHSIRNSWADAPHVVKLSRSRKPNEMALLLPIYYLMDIGLVVNKNVIQTVILYEEHIQYLKYTYIWDFNICRILINKICLMLQ